LFVNYGYGDWGSSNALMISSASGRHYIKVVPSQPGREKAVPPVDDAGWTERSDQFDYALTIPDIYLMMPVIFECTHEPLLAPACIALRTEKNCALVIVHTVNRVSLVMKECSNFGANKSGGTGYNNVFHFIPSKLCSDTLSIVSVMSLHSAHGVDL
jgi:hypothetical protein